MIRFFKKHNAVYIDPAEERFDQMIALIKDLPRADYNRLKGAMDLGYSAYQKVKNVKTEDEHESADLTTAEKILEKEAS